MRKIILFFRSRQWLLKRITQLEPEIRDLVRRNDSLHLRLETYLEIIEREKEYNLSRRMKRRNRHWRKQNKQFRIK